jgi:hypothetical protein
MLLLDYKKICTKCGEEKSSSLFRKNKLTKDGYHNKCKQCLKNYDKNNYHKYKEKRHAYKKQHKKEIQKYQRQWHDNHKEQDHKKSKLRFIKRKTDNNYILYRRKYCKERKENDINFYIVWKLRNRILQAIKQNSKKGKTSELLGCTINHLLIHLQKTAINNGYIDFDINNHKKREYHIDHIIPCSAFNLKCEYHQKLCFNYTNLQILKAEENLKKHKTIPEKLLVA